jgi:DNA polymerase-3 subunit gamma/tau
MQLSEQVSAEDLQLFYQIALIGRRDLPLSPDARSGFEMILLRMLAFRPVSADVGHHRASAARPATPPVTTPAGDSQPRLQTKLQHAAQTRQVSANKANKTAALSADAAGSVNHQLAEPVKVPGNTPAVAKPATPPAAADDCWGEIVNSLALGGLVKQLAINCTMKQRNGNKIVLQIAAGHSNLINVKAKQRLQQALGEYFNIDAQLEIEVTDNIDAESPAQSIQRETRQRQQQAERAIDEDSFAQTLKEKFNAEIIPGSVKPLS